MKTLLSILFVYLFMFLLFMSGNFNFIYLTSGDAIHWSFSEIKLIFSLFNFTPFR